jgi:hypothetical protein
MTIDTIRTKIQTIRGKQVMLDSDLALLYEVETRVLKQAVRRNMERFPEDFMFELSTEEIEQMVSQIVIPSKSYLGGAKPFAFTEQGVAMLSSVLKSQTAIRVNIQIVRVFVSIRQIAQNHDELAGKLKELETRFNKQFEDVFEALNYLVKLEPIKTERRRIGYTG